MRSWSLVLAFVLALCVLATPADATPWITAERFVTAGDTLYLVDTKTSPDITRIRVQYHLRPGEIVEVWTTPDRLSVDTPGAPDRMVVMVTAFDAKGEATSTMVGTSEPQRRYRCGMHAMALLFIVFPACLVILAFVLIVGALIRRRALRLPGEPVSPLAAELLARATLERKLLTIAISFAVVLGLYVTGEHLWAGIVAYVPITRLLHVAIIRGFLRIIDGSAELHDNLLAVGGRYIVVPRCLTHDLDSRSVPLAFDRRRRDC